MTRAGFALILDRMNADHRGPGQCTPAVCRVCDDDGEVARVANAVLAWEVKTRKDTAGGFTRPGRRATPSDFEAVAAIAAECQRRAGGIEMKEAA